MALSTTEKLRKRFPQFEDTSDYPDDDVEFFIAEASVELNSDVWGQLWQKGVIALAAHMIAIADKSGNNDAIGALASWSTGSTSESYQPGTGQPGDDPSLNSTHPGREFLRLSRKRTAMGFST